MIDLLRALADELPGLRLTHDGPDVTGLPCDLIRQDDTDYMRRFFRFGRPNTNGATARYHQILRSDDDRHLHDHPWDFISVILDGSYVETTESGEVEHGRGSVLTRSAESAHRLTLKAPVWSFVITAPARRRWGFHTEDGWVPWRTYLAAPSPHPRAPRQWG